ncbi:hypothetical protein PROFUN_06867 [Planoprotostelium fungivorum]|uniref:DEP domain-containing protein n=1 Tax=Planoprotostelium fungivorum TaxID=1890364 RepID=A0A2P6NNL8_9EUKA|nr:hypothetical protein PROFUN_06867 [Planoprotostelium fungivorum]
MKVLNESASSSRSDMSQAESVSSRIGWNKALRRGNDYFSASDDEQPEPEEVSSYHSSLAFSPKPIRPVKNSPARDNQENQPPKQQLPPPTSPTSPMKNAPTPKVNMSVRATHTPEMSLRRDFGSVKVKFEMPKIAADGHSEAFDIQMARKHLKKSRSVLRTSKDRKKQEMLSMRVMNLPVDKSIAEDRVDDILVRLLEDAAGFKMKPTTYKGKTYESFSGEQLARWIGGNLYLDEKESIQFAQTALMNRGIFISLSGKHQSFHAKKDVFYAFKFHETIAPLNACKFHLEDVSDPVGLSKSLVMIAIRLLTENRTIDGKVAFDTGKSSKNYYRMAVLSARLQMVNLGAMTSQELSAFFVNVYNALSIHCRFADGREPAGKVERKSMNYRMYLISQSVWGLEDIMSSLRGVSSRGPYKGCHPVLPCLLFDGSDRSAHIVPYSTDDFSFEGLRSIISHHLEKNMHIDSSQELVFLPKIFKTIGPDFGPQTKNMFNSLSQLLDSKYLSQYADSLGVMYYENTFDRVRYVE